MSEALQKRRRTDRWKDRLAGITTALLLAGLVAALVELQLLVIGQALGDANWHRAWVEARLQQSLEWLGGAPLVGPLASMLIDPKSGALPRHGVWRDMVVLGMVLFAPCLWAGARIGPVLIARYDDEALRPTPPVDLGLRWAGPLGAVQNLAWTQLQTWCQAGMGTGRSPFWRPWVLPDAPERFSVAVMVGENGGGKSHLAEAFARHLDRDEELASLAATSRLKAWRFKLGVKWQELWWWRQRSPNHPWDCGYLVEDPAARARLTQFRPRRPTLLIADELRDSSLHEALEALSAARVDFRQPVRLLIIDVALPGTLALRFEAPDRWKTGAYGLGTASIVNLTGARFQVAQLRGLVGAQAPLANGADSHLLGPDADWAPVTTALDEQPILVAEAVRWVRQESGRRYDDLRSPSELTQLAERLAASQAEPSTPVLAPDELGQRRELLRERVLHDRAAHRQEGLRQALGEQAGDVAFHALMVATAAGGGSAARLARLLGLQANPLTPKRLRAAFAQQLPADWVPPVKPAVIADELLRLHFNAPAGAPLSPDAQERVREFLRHAWMLNPGGARHTVARWQARRRPDAFALAMIQLPTLTDLQGSMQAGQRVELVRAFVELAVFHAGDLAHARAALEALEPDERRSAHSKLQAVLLHPDAGGVPALLLWLDLQRLTFPQAGELTAAQAESLGLSLARQALQLLRQCVLVSVPVDRALEAALDDAAFATLPLLARLGDVLATSADFAASAWELSRSTIGIGDQLSAGQANRLRHRMRVGLLAALVHTRAQTPAVRSWSHWVLTALWQLDIHAAAPSLDEVWTPAVTGTENGVDDASLPPIAVARALALWTWCHFDEAGQVAECAQRLGDFAQGFPEDAQVQHAAAEAWQVLSLAHSDTDCRGSGQAAQKAADIAARFEWHEGIQLEAAAAWSNLSWACKGTDAQAVEQAAQKVAEIAARFDQHEGIQLQAAQAWLNLSWTQKNADAKATEKAAQKVADIAARFDRNEGIQLRAAEAWSDLSWAHKDSDVQAVEFAAHKAANIATRFDRHEGIRLAAAFAWRLVSWAHRASDVQATERAVQKVADIAIRFDWHQHFQFEAAEAWCNLSWACKDTDAHATEQAAQKVAEIAARFDQHEGIQLQAVQAWLNLSWAHRNTDAQATEKAAQKIAHIAARFDRNEGIQLRAAEAWSNLSWAHKDSDVQAVEHAARKVADIAAHFDRNEVLQLLAAKSWIYVSWASKDTDAQATEQAAQKAVDIAARFDRNEDIQFEAARAFRLLSSVHMETNAQATQQAAQKLAEIAARFGQHEGIQIQAAYAWCYAALAAVKFEDESLISRASRALDELVGISKLYGSWSAPRMPVNGRIQEPFQLALVAVNAWRAKRGGGAA